MSLTDTHPAVPLQCLHQGVVRVAVKVQPLVHLLEVQVFEGGGGLGAFLARGASLAGRAFQVVLVVHPHLSRQHVVHDDHADVDAGTLDAVQAVELGKQGPGVLVQVLEWRDAMNGGQTFRKQHQNRV